MSTSSIKKLLLEVTASNKSLRKAKELLAYSFAPDFRLFDFMRADEQGLSRCIASLLDPRGTHGQGDTYLKLFLNSLELETWQEIGNLTATQVFIEYPANGRRIDLLLKFGSGEVLAIENKPWAQDQYNQLADYAEFLNKANKKTNWLLIYLANKSPSEYSIAPDLQRYLTDKECFSIYGFEKLTDWLEHCLAVTRPIKVRFFIEELKFFIDEQVNGRYLMENENETINLITASTDNMRAAFDITNNLVNAQEKLLQQLKEQLNTKIADKNITFIWQGNIFNRNKGAGFYFEIEQLYSHDLTVFFEFEDINLKTFIWGIRRRNKDVLLDESKWLFFNKEMVRLGYREVPIYEWWPWYQCGAPGDNLASDGYSDWSSNPEPWQDIINGSLAEAIYEVVSTLHQGLKHYK